MVYEAPEIIEIGKAEDVVLGRAFIGSPDSDHIFNRAWNNNLAG